MGSLKERLVFALVPALAGCGGPLSTLAPQGPAAKDIAVLWWGMLAGATLITLLVMALVARSFLRPPSSGPSPRFWIKTMGLGFSFAVLAATVGAGIWIGERIQPKPAADVVTVAAEARQWGWSFEQSAPDGTPLRTEGRLYIPAGRPVDVRITSRDVIHSFWVPQLAGKMDALPGRVNVLRIEADRPGLYHGRSAEFSGIGYAGMRFEVVAYDIRNAPEFTDLKPVIAP